MSENQNPTPRPGVGLGALITTGIVSAVIAFSGALLYFHYFPQVKELPAPVVVLDMVKLGASIAKMSEDGSDSKPALTNAGEGIAQLKAAGYIILDARYVISAPDQYVVEPSDLIPGAPDLDFGSGYVRPDMQPIPAEKTEEGMR